MKKVFRASRWNRNSRQSLTSGVVSPESAVDGQQDVRTDDGEGDYLNCPMNAAEYRAFYAALTTAESATVHDFDREKFFEGCLPIEVMAHRGEDTLRFGPMKPVGLVDPRTGTAAVCGRSAAAGQPGRRSLQPRGIPDAVEVGRAGAGAADDSRARARRVRAVRDGSPQHLHQRADGAPRDVADAREPRAVLCRSDLRRRRLRGVGRVRADGRAQRRRAGRGATSCACRRERRRSVRSRFTCRTPIRTTISRRTSRSASWSRRPRAVRDRHETQAGHLRAGARGLAEWSARGGQSAIPVAQRLQPCQRA